MTLLRTADNTLIYRVNLHIQLSNTCILYVPPFLGKMCSVFSFLSTHSYLFLANEKSSEFTSVSALLLLKCRCIVTSEICMLCYVMLCYVMLCYVMLCYVMLCYVMLYVV